MDQLQKNKFEGDRFKVAFFQCSDWRMTISYYGLLKKVKKVTHQQCGDSLLVSTLKIQIIPYLKFGELHQSRGLFYSCGGWLCFSIYLAFA
jgi:hypothetical protein